MCTSNTLPIGQPPLPMGFMTSIFRLTLFKTNSRDWLLLQVFPYTQMDISSTQKLKQLTEVSLKIFLCTCYQASSLGMSCKCLSNTISLLYFISFLLFLSRFYHLSPGWLYNSNTWCRINTRSAHCWMNSWVNEQTGLNHSLIISGQCYKVQVWSFLNNNPDYIFYLLKFLQRFTITYRIKSKILMSLAPNYFSNFVSYYPLIIIISNTYYM